MRPLTPWIFLALLAGAAGCGRTSSSSGSDAGGTGDAGTIDAGTSVDSAMGGADSSPEAMYAGLVLGMVTQDETGTRYVARAVFSSGPRPTIGGCPHCCCGSTDRGLPVPGKPPDAGRLTIGAAAGANTLATLAPGAFSGGSGTYYGMSDLGWSWFSSLSDYAPVDSQPWSPGDALQISATGNEVGSFSGLLRTGPSLAGVTPPIGFSPVVADHSQAFEVSWIPEGNGNATVLLGIPYGGGICYCDAPDSAGKLVVDPSLLSPISVEQNGKISLARLTISTVASGNAMIDLVGAVVQAGPLVVQ
jgi:hypothetical protein